MFPMANGSYLITEATGSWVDELDLSGRVAWSVHLPGFTCVYESNEIGPNRYLTVDHASPGKVVTFDRTGRVLELRPDRECSSGQAITRATVAQR